MSKVYEFVQERIVKAIENSIENGLPAPWVKPWNRLSMPKNFITKKEYRGINLLLLEAGGYYITKKQLDKLQKKYDFLKLKKKPTAHMVVFWEFKEPKIVKVKNDSPEVYSEEEDVVKPGYSCFKYYKVFHESDIEGFEKLVDSKDLDSVINDINDAERLIEEYNEIVPIRNIDSDNAYYNPSLDSITVPLKECFNNIEEYYSTTFHEMIHSTGHADRLNRFDKVFKFGDHNYSKEELVAEIGAAMLCAEFNVENEQLTNNSTSYLYGWLSAIKKDVRLITNAAQQAQKACDYIVNATNIHHKLNDTLDIVS